LARLSEAADARQEMERPDMVLASASSTVSVNIIPTTGPLDLIFHQTWIALKILGWPPGAPITLNLIQLIIFAIIALAAVAVTERLTGSKPGGMAAAVIITIFGAWLFTHFVTLPVELIVEGVPIIAALLGAIVVAVFYVLLRKQFGGK
jgi:hypothetical protein